VDNLLGLFDSGKQHSIWMFPVCSEERLGMTGLPRVPYSHLGLLQAGKTSAGLNALAGALASAPRANSLSMTASSYPYGIGLGHPRPGGSLFGGIAPTKRKVFVSYHHGGDQAYHDEFCSRFSTSLSVFSDRSLDRARDSEDAEYIMRYIRENHLTGASTLIVLCGAQTRWRKYVDWEISAGLRQEMSLVGIKLPTGIFQGGGLHKPDRLQDNLDSGYAVLGAWESIIQDPGVLTSLIETANARRKCLINNSRPRRMRNG
jgi:hypothetical protein